MKKRLDQILVDKGLAESKTKAQALIMAGQVFVAGQISDKAGKLVPDDSEIAVKELFLYVSRGALKLEKAFQEFNLDFNNKTVCDIGSSTGGFTDFALQHGAAKVYAVDVGTRQLAQKLREDPRVVVIEQTDFRDVCFQGSDPDQGPTLPEPIDMFVCDVSFISLKKIIPHVVSLLLSPASLPVRSYAEEGQIKYNQLTGHSALRPEGLIAQARMRDLDSRLPSSQELRRTSRGNDVGSIDIILLIKPQFEAGVKEVTRGKGVIRDEALRLAIVEDIKNFAIKNGFIVSGLVQSPITGAKGNVEYLLYLTL